MSIGCNRGQRVCETPLNEPGDVGIAPFLIELTIHRTILALIWSHAAIVTADLLKPTFFPEGRPLAAATGIGDTDIGGPVIVWVTASLAGHAFLIFTIGAGRVDALAILALLGGVSTLIDKAPPTAAIGADDAILHQGPIAARVSGIAFGHAITPWRVHIHVPLGDHACSIFAGASALTKFITAKEIVAAGGLAQHTVLDHIGTLAAGLARLAAIFE